MLDLYTRLILFIAQAVGSVHDFALYKESTGSAMSPDVQAKVDSGYQGILDYHDWSLIPIKKSKKKELSDSEKAFNRELSRRRIVIENINAQIKVFKIMCTRSRSIFVDRFE